LSPPLPSSLASIKPANPVHLKKWPLKRRECLDTVAWVTGKDFWPVKNLASAIVKSSLGNLQDTQPNLR